VDFRLAVNLLSKQHPSELLYLADETFQHPTVQDLATRPDGSTPLPSTPGGLALAFIRANLFDRTMLRAVPAPAPGPDNDLADKFDFVARAAADPAARGTPSASGGTRTGHARQRVRVHTGNGMHDIHMNQRNRQPFAVTTCLAGRRPVAPPPDPAAGVGLPGVPVPGMPHPRPDRTRDR
jgi:uncharacterized protein YukJ